MITRVYQYALHVGGAQCQPVSCTTGQCGDGRSSPNVTGSSGETSIHSSVASSRELPEEDISKRRQLPVDTCERERRGDTNGLLSTPAIQPGSIYACDTDHPYSDDSSSNTFTPAETETPELGHNDDITDRKHVMEYFIHPVTSMYVYMKSESGGAPYVCEDCDYKATVNYMFLDHMNLHYNYSDSDDSE